MHPSTGTVLRKHRPEVISVSAAVAEELETPSRVVRSFAEHRWTARRRLAERSEIARRRAHLGADDQVVLFAGRANSPTKGADLLLGAAEMLWADGATFHLVFAGPFWVRGRHKEIVERNADRVATIGVLSRPRLFAWYRAAMSWSSLLVTSPSALLPWKLRPSALRSLPARPAASSKS